jgi:dTDP-4-dehydrorhamnose reductase
MKLLLTGAKGQVGWSVQKQVREQANAGAATIEVIPTDLEELDIADLNAVQVFCDQERPDIILNAAAYTAVDQAETNRELAYKVNAEGPKNLAQVSAERGIPLLHISTDYVYDGIKTSAYIESDPIAPHSVYGETKAQGDEFVSGMGDSNTWLILRTAWVYSAHGNNFVKTMLRLAAERDEISVVSDQQGNPTCATDIAAAMLEVINLIGQGEKVPSGIFHYTGQGATNWYEFTVEIFRQAHELGMITRVPTVHPISTKEYPTPAKRPANSVLDCAKIQAGLPSVKLPRWQDSLGIMLRELRDIG